MDYTVDLDARMPSPLHDEDLGRFLDALERLAIAPVVSYNTETRLLSARFIVAAPTAKDGVNTALLAFSTGLLSAELPPASAFTALHVVEEEREEAAALT